MSAESRRFLVDCHNDLVQELVYRRAEENPFRSHLLPELSHGNVRIQVCPIYIWWDELGERALRSGLEQVLALKAAADENNDVSIIRDQTDLEKVVHGEDLGILISTEGVECLGPDPALLDVYFELGVRMIALTHFQRNMYADGNGEASTGGVSALGRRLLAMIDERDIILDLAHASDQTFLDALETATTSQVVVSHTGCRSLVDTQRNITDDQLRQVAERGGVVGIYACPPFLGGESIDRMIDHLFHALEVAGPDHVGLGGDFTARLHRCPGLVRLPPWIEISHEDALARTQGLEGPDGYPALVARLEERGINGETLDAVLSKNLLRVFREGLPR